MKFAQPESFQYNKGALSNIKEHLPRCQLCQEQQVDEYTILKTGLATKFLPTVPNI